LAAPEESATTPTGVPPPPRRTIVLRLRGPIDRADVPKLCERARVLLEATEADLAICDVGELADPDAATVEALARLQLTARRLGRRVSVRRACGELKDLVALMGLAEVVPCVDSDLDAGRQPEQREPPGRIEEEGDPADPVA
jgi:ABC-type transporter Mla MlaB component